jgi:cell wall-associated NlpC family hydrolase
MRRFLAALALAAALAAPARAQTVPDPLPSFTEPNAPGSIVAPEPLSVPPAVPARRSYDELLVIWQQAGAAYGIPWQVLAAVNKVETGFGGNMGPSSAGAIGWMQFLPSTWERWGMDGDGDGVADPWDPEDAIFAAARYLAAAGAHEDLARAVFAYNHSDVYVRNVLTLASTGSFAFDGLPELAGPLPWATSPFQRFFAPDVDALLDQARADAKRLTAEVAEAQSKVDTLGWRILAARQRTGDPSLPAGEFARLDAEIAALVAAQASADERLQLKKAELSEARLRVRGLVRQTRTVAFALDSTFTLDGVTWPAARSVLSWAVAHVGRFGYSMGPTTDRGGDVLAMQTLEPAGPTCDCSMFTRWAMAQAGIDVGLTTVSQWPANGLLPDDETAVETAIVSRGVGPEPPLGGWVPGDLVFWGHGGGGAGHVALYLGGGLIVQCSGGVGSNVRPLDSYGPPTGWVRWHTITGTAPAAFASVAPAARTLMSVVAEQPAEQVFTVAPEPGVVTFTQ